jgi:glycosyltransferase involved in cell wall biosynthesis
MCKEVLVSVIIPNFNYGRFLETTLRSVFLQTHQNIEIIVVDDGSTDNSSAIYSKYSDRLQVILQENLGVSASRNIGITRAHGEFIAFLDADDCWKPSKIKNQILKQRETGADIVFSGVEICDENLSHIALSPTESLDCSIHAQYLENPTKAVIPLATSNALISTNLVQKVGFFDESLSISADWDFLRRSTHFANDIVFQNSYDVIYRTHKGNMTSQSNSFPRESLICLFNTIRDEKKTHLSYFQIMKITTKILFILLKYYLKICLSRMQKPKTSL